MTIHNEQEYIAALDRLTQMGDYDPEAVVIMEEIEDYERKRIWLPGEGRE